MANIRQNNDNDSTLSLRTNATSIRKNDVATKFGIDLTLTTNHSPVSSLLPFPTTVLPFHFHCITCIDFTYHPTLWKNHTLWIKSILPLLQLFISSFHLKYIFLFSHQHSHDQCSLDSLVPLTQSGISSWNISPHSILSHFLGDNISCSRSFLYLSPIKFYLLHYLPPNLRRPFPTLLLGYHPHSIQLTLVISQRLILSTLAQ